MSSNFQMISDLNTYLTKAVPDTRLTVKKYLDAKFEYLVGDVGLRKITINLYIKILFKYKPYGPANLHKESFTGFFIAA